ADLPAADPDKVVPVADAGGDDVDEDLACGRRRRLVQLEDLDRLAECCDPSRPHLFGARYACPSCAGPLWHLARGVRPGKRITRLGQRCAMTPDEGDGKAVRRPLSRPRGTRPAANGRDVRCPTLLAVGEAYEVGCASRPSTAQP